MKIHVVAMTDNRSPEQRRHIMQSVRTKDTGPEQIVRKLLFRLGYRYRLHSRDLPGRPDIVFHGRRKAIFVHGCFWHSHGCAKGQAPRSKLDYWGPKLRANQVRDTATAQKLERLGWSVLTIWQCEIKDMPTMEATLVAFLGPSVEKSIDTIRQIV